MNGEPMTDATQPTAPGLPAADAATQGKRRDRAPLSALRPLLPYGLRYKGRIAAAVAALVLASMATLAIPVAVRRMVDLGFSPEGAGIIDR
jgi:ATP-binding cassette subfamily B protein